MAIYHACRLESCMRMAWPICYDVVAPVRLSVDAMRDARLQADYSTVGLVFTQVWGYAKVWVLGRSWLRLGPRFGGAADPGFTPRSRGFGANPENPPGAIDFSFIVAPLLYREASCHKGRGRGRGRVRVGGGDGLVEGSVVGGWW